MKAAESQTLLQNPTSIANGDSKSKSPSSKPKKEKKNSNKEEEKKKKSESEKEGDFLLGEPTYKKLSGVGGRWRCVETGQEMPEKEKEGYSKSRACRIGLINSFVAKKRAPLNVFEQNPTNENQLICKITGDAVNKSEEHIWKHLNGIRFNNKLAQMELEAMKTPEEILKEEEERKLKELKKKKKNPVNKKMKEREAKKKEMEAMLSQLEKTVEKEETKSKKDKKKKKKKKKETEEEEEEEMEVEVEEKEGKKKPKKEKKEKKKKEIEASGGGEEEEPEFWMPPVGERWDFDDGKDEIGEEDPESGELTTRSKRLSIDAVGPSSFASRKKKMKKSS